MEVIQSVAQRPINQHLAREPTREEAAAIVGKRKAASAPGRDGLSGFYVRALIDEQPDGTRPGLDALFEVVLYTWRREKVDGRWLTGKLSLLPKSGDLSLIRHWRGITLTDMAKISARF